MNKELTCDFILLPLGPNLGEILASLQIQEAWTRFNRSHFLGLFTLGIVYYLLLFPIQAQQKLFFQVWS